MRVDFEGGAGCRAHIPSLRRLPVAHQIFYSLIFVSSYLCMQHVSNLKSTCGPHTGKHLRCHSFSSAVSTIQVIIWSTESGDRMKVQLHKLDLDALNTFDCCHPSINADCFLPARMWCWMKLHTWILKSVSSDSGGLAWAYILHARLSTNLNQDITLNKVTEWAQYMATSNLEKEINKCVLGLNRRQRP